MNWRLAAILMLGVLCMATAAHARRPVRLASVCLLNGAQYENLEYVLSELDKVPTGTDLVVLPHMPFLTYTSVAKNLKPFCDFAASRHTYLALSLMEQDGNRTYATAELLDREGRPVGHYRKVHALADDAVSVGDNLQPFATDFGKVGLTIGTDFYVWETYQVLALKGAEVITWHVYPERVRDHSTWEPLLLARALDSHAFLATAMYADPRAYITNSWEQGMPGAAWGRSMIVNRVGTPVADTGYDEGVATAVVDLDKRKQDVYWPESYEGENLFFVNNYGNRAAFLPLIMPYTPPKLPTYQKRTCRLAVAWLPRTQSWRQGVMPDELLKLVDQAAALKPDLLLFSEQSTRLPDDLTAQAMRAVSDKARQYGMYIAVGGVGDAGEISIMRVWDRQGKEVYDQALYWVKGYDEIKVFDTDFGRIGSHECGDLYLPEFDRTLALLGAEIIIDGSQMWGPSGRVNETLLRARAIDNGVWVACAHWPTSDPSLRSLIIDPYGQVMASSTHTPEGIIAYDLNLDQKRGYYAGQKAEQAQPGTSGIPAYFSSNLPDCKPGWRDMLFAARRPDLYGVIPTENEVTRRYRGAQPPKF